MIALAAVWKFLTSKGGLIIIASLLVIGAFYGYGWSRYNEGKKEVQEQFTTYRLETEAAWKENQDELERQRRVVEKLAADKAKAVATAERNLTTKLTKRMASRLATQRRIDDELKLGSHNVVAPRSVWLRYNDSVYDYGYTDQERADYVARNPAGNAQASATIDANPVAKTLTDNVEAYNELAERHNALVGIVKEIQERNRNAQGN